MQPSLECINKAMETNPKLNYDTYPYNAFSTSMGSTVFEDGCLEAWGKDYDSILLTDDPYKNVYCTEEVFKDARNATTNNGAIPENVYLQQLRQEGLESITKFTKAFTGKVYFGAIKYRQDINVGDICVIENTRWDLSVNARLVEVIESVAETGAYTITPTFAV